MSTAVETDLFSLLHGHKYLNLTSYRKNGQAVSTPLWFAEQNGRLFFMTRDDSWKFKRIGNNPEVKIAPCNIRGRILGPEVAASVRILPEREWEVARKALQRKYWLTRIPWLWSKHNTYMEILPQK